MFMYFQKEAVNLNKRNLANDEDNNPIAAIPSITDKEQKDDLRVSTFMMAQNIVTDSGACENVPNVTTALLADCTGNGEHEMSIFTTNENRTESCLETQNECVALNLINHTQIHDVNEAGCKGNYDHNGYHCQDDLLNPTTLGKFL